MTEFPENARTQFKCMECNGTVVNYGEKCVTCDDFTWVCVEEEWVDISNESV